MHVFKGGNTFSRQIEKEKKYGLQVQKSKELPLKTSTPLLYVRKQQERRKQNFFFGTDNSETFQLELVTFELEF